MKLVIAKVGFELLIGKTRDLFSATLATPCLENAMTVIIEQRMMPPKLAGQQPQQVRGYNLLPVPSNKIYLTSVTYWGEVDPRDPIAELYARVEKALQEQMKSPLMVAQ